ncbi:hypothetical protein KAI68_02205 [bacterium]|nr:hypothetical protein [bacterium]
MDKKNIFLLTEKGMVLPLVVLMVLVLIPVGLGLSNLTKIETEATVRAKATIRAVQVADAGIKRAMVEVTNNPGYTGFSSFASESVGSVDTLSSGQYSIGVSTPGSIPPGESAVLPDGRYQISAIGYVPNVTNIQEKRKIVVTAERIDIAPFDFAITAGAGGVDLSGGDCQIQGDVITSGTVTNPERVTGTVSEGESAVDDFEPPEMPGVYTSDLGEINLVGLADLVLTAGTYICSSINIGGTARITIDSTLGPVIIYCSGDIDAGGTGIVNSSLDATNFLIYGTGPVGSTVRFDGTADLYAAVYAPAYDAILSGTSLADGSMNVHSFTSLGTADMDYNDALNGLPGGVLKTKILSWREEKI